MAVLNVKMEQTNKDARSPSSTKLAVYEITRKNTENIIPEMMG